MHSTLRALGGFVVKNSMSRSLLNIGVPKIGRMTSRAPPRERHPGDDLNPLVELGAVVSAHPVRDERLAREPTVDAPAAVVVDHAAEHGEVRHALDDLPVRLADSREPRGDEVHGAVRADERDPLVEVLVRVHALERPVPAVHLLVEERAHAEGGVEREVPADVAGVHSAAA
jgi:hypothetical protein